jgi:hypothetical protein
MTHLAPADAYPLGVPNSTMTGVFSHRFRSKPARNAPLICREIGTVDVEEAVAFDGSPANLNIEQDDKLH